MILALTACLSFVTARGGTKFGRGGHLIILYAGKNLHTLTHQYAERHLTFTFSHFADAFIQSDLQLGNT